MELKERGYEGCGRRALVSAPASARTAGRHPVSRLYDEGRIGADRYHIMTAMPDWRW